MAAYDIIDEFLALKKLAVGGASRSRSKFGNRVYLDLRSKGYTVYPVNPNAGEVEGDRCYPDLASLPEPVEGLVLVTPPEVSEELIREAARVGIRRVWLQPGAESDAVLDLCAAHGIVAVSDECILVQ